MSLFSATNLSIHIANKTVCKDLNFACQPGEVWGVLGRNGQGKTTLLHSLAGLHKLDAGSIEIQNTPLSELSRREIAQHLGLLLQHHEDSFPCSVFETVISGRHPHIHYWQWHTQSDIDMAYQALQAVHMDDLAERSIHQLSGGERQRAAIANLLTQNPDIMLLDEPNSHLDLKFQIQILNLLRDISKSQHKALIMSLHDINLAAEYCDQLMLLMGNGDVLMGSPDELLTEENLLELYEHPVRRIHTDKRTFFSAT